MPICTGSAKRFGMHPAPHSQPASVVVRGLQTDNLEFGLASPLYHRSHRDLGNYGEMLPLRVGASGPMLETPAPTW